MDPDTNEIPSHKALRQVRLDAGLTLKALGKELKCSAAMLAACERGEVSPPLVVVQDWARACGARLVLIFERSES